MPNYWILLVSEDNFLFIKEHNIYGCRDIGCRWAMKKVGKGDIVITYVIKEGCKNYCSSFTGAFMVVSDWVKNEKPIFPDEVKMNNIIYEYIVHLKPIVIGKLNIYNVIQKLSFTREQKLNKALHSVAPTYSFSKPLSEGDAEIIINELKRRAI